MNADRKTTKISLVVERGDGGLWGRVKVNGNLIVDSASSLQVLKSKMKKLVLEFEDVEVSEFDISYDLTSFFEHFSYLNISDIAERSGVNPGLMRQYASGVKFPSEERVKEIQQAIHLIGKELSKVKLHKPKKEYV